MAKRKNVAPEAEVEAPVDGAVATEVAPEVTAEAAPEAPAKRVKLAINVAPEFGADVPPPSRKRRVGALKYAELLRTIASAPGTNVKLGTFKRGSASALVAVLRSTIKRMPELGGEFKFITRTEEGGVTVWVLFKS